MASALLKKVQGKAHLHAAWRVIQENARTSKSDDVKNQVKVFEANASAEINSISGRLQRKSFKFLPARGIPVPKTDKSGRKSFNKIRPLVLAPLEARIVQRAIHDVLVNLPALRPYAVSPYSFGGVKKASKYELSAVPAAIQCILDNIASGAHFVMTADIEGFFTRISKEHVTRIIAEAAQDEPFIDLFRQAIHVELSNMAELRSRNHASAFPIEDIGVAQGNCLSPLLGNIVLHSFDSQMNTGDCRCIRYVDDFIILAPTRKAAKARMEMAKVILSNLEMNLSPGKSLVEPVRTTEKFEFLGIELNNGFIRPSSRALNKLLGSISDSFDSSRNEFRKHKSGTPLAAKYSFLSTLKRVDGIVHAWGRHYWFCNDATVFAALDEKITSFIRDYIGEYSNTLKRARDKDRRTLLGIELLAETERRPFKWKRDPTQNADELMPISAK